MAADQSDVDAGSAGFVLAARLGADPRTVVDALPRAHGVPGPRVADCSIVREIVSGMTSAPAIMIGG